jgi:hypothetical protein
MRMSRCILVVALFLAWRGHSFQLTSSTSPIVSRCRTHFQCISQNIVYRREKSKSNRERKHGRLRRRWNKLDSDSMALHLAPFCKKRKKTGNEPRQTISDNCVLLLCLSLFVVYTSPRYIKLLISLSFLFLFFLPLVLGLSSSSLQSQKLAAQSI